MPVQPEFPSLANWLTEKLTERELSHVGLVSFNQWPFTTAVLMEVALTAESIGAEVSIGFWADETPLPDAGWSTSRVLAKLTLSRTLDERAERLLIKHGLPQASVCRPPIRNWRPSHLPVLPDPLTRSAIREMTYLDSGAGRSILQVHPSPDTPIRDDYEWPSAYVEEALHSYAWAYDQTREFVRSRGIRSLVVFNGRFTHDRAAASAAEAEGIRVLYFDVGGIDTQGFDLTTAATHDWTDLQFRMMDLWDRTPEPTRTAEAQAWFRNRREHTEPGIDVFLEHQERGHLPDIPECEQLVVFFSSSPDEIAELEIDWSQYLNSQTQALGALADACRERPGTALIVRTHPHMRLKPTDDLIQWRRAVSSASPVMHFDAGDPADSYALMQRADIVFTYGSTSGIEAAALGRPVVVMGPSAYDVLGCARRIRHADEIPGALESPPDASIDRALPFGLMMRRRGFAFERLGRTSEGRFSLGGAELIDGNEWTRKLSDAQKKRKLRRLLPN